MSLTPDSVFTHSRCLINSCWLYDLSVSVCIFQPIRVNGRHGHQQLWVIPLQLPHQKRKWSFSLSVHACLQRHFSCVWLFATLWTIAHQTPLSIEFSRQEYWSRLPCPTPGDLPDPGMEVKSLTSPALAGGFFTTSTTYFSLLDILLSLCFAPFI